MSIDAKAAISSPRKSMHDSRPPSEGMLIEFNGIHGSGKTVMVEMTERYLNSKGIHCFRTGIITDRIKNHQHFKNYHYIKSNDTGESFEMLLLMLDDVTSLYNETLVSYLKEDYAVICRRFLFSCIAETAIHIKDTDLHDLLIRIIQTVRSSDLTICLDVSPDIAEKRIRQKKLEGKVYRDFPYEVLKDECAVYKKLADQFNVPVINSDGPPEETFEYVKPFIDRLIDARRNTDVKKQEMTPDFKEDLLSNEIIKILQLITHDIKKPFLLLTSSMNLIKRSNDPEILKWIVEESIPVIKKSLQSVNTMLTDVFEIGSTPKSIKKPVNPAELINTALWETFTMIHKPGIMFMYDFKHVHPVSTDALKINRVFANIIENAAQVIKESGIIWFRTRETGDYMEFCIGNDGSFIPDEHRSRIFELFYTSGKSAGTGLGLAVAKKIVEDYGGNIWCVSSSEKMETEFYFTLPVDNNLAGHFAEALPECSDEVINNYKANLERIRY